MQALPMAFVEFRGVKKAFGPKRVYRDLNLDIHRGEALTIVGGSGQGKSVMLKLLTGLLRIDEGTIHFDGERIDHLDETGYAPVRRRVQMLFQGGALFDSMRVVDNVKYGMREAGEMGEDEMSERARESLEQVGLAGMEAKWPSELSAGMKKRVGLARAIAIRPDVLLYDEPTTGLDPDTIRVITDLILRLQQTLQVTSVVVTHDMPAVFKLSQRIAMIQDGGIIFEGSPQEFVRSADARVNDFVHGNAPEDEDVEALLRSAG
ncbi:MAG: ATP-binding cassette domain-containing protein [Myxococcota bacterium]